MEAVNQKSGIWNLFFVYVGFMTLIAWNLVLNVTPYFIFAIDKDYFSVLSFAFILAQTVAFLTANQLFGKLSSKAVFVVVPLLMLVSFYLILFFVEFPAVPKEDQAKNVLWNKVLTFVFTSILGFVSAVFQGRSVAVCSKNGEKEVVLWNFGGALSGVLASLLAIALGFAFPDPPLKPDDTPDRERSLEVMRLRIFVYLVVCLLLFVGYYLVNYLFNRDNRSAMEDKEELLEQMTASQSEGPSASKVVAKSLSLLLSIFFLYVVTIHFLVKIVVVVTKVHHSKTFTLTLGIFFLVFNAADAAGKFLKPFLAGFPDVVLHVFNALRLAVWGTGFFICRSEHVEGSFIQGSLFFCLMLFLIGFSNGLLTNSLMVKAADRFSMGAEKGMAGYYSVLFLILGLLGGSLLGLVV